MAVTRGPARPSPSAQGGQRPDLRVVSLDAFIRAAASSVRRPLPPLVHSTPSRNIFDILSGSHLKPLMCNVYREKLCYLFVGRPAYKWTTQGDASRWQLPLVFVLKPTSCPMLKRIYPFDTGAFAAGRLPDYMAGFDMETFNLGTDLDAAAGLIEAFFGSAERYGRASAIDGSDLRTKHALGPEHQEIEALARLYSERSNIGVDDRARTIELQTGEDVTLTSDNVLGVVLPKQYAEHQGIAAELSALGCLVEAYDEYPLKVDAYYGIIYERVQKILRGGPPV